MSESEKRRFEKFMTRRQATPIAVKFVTKEGKNGRDALTQDTSYGAENAMAAFSAASGSVDSDFCCKLFNQVVNGSPLAGLGVVEHSNAVAAAMTGLAPQNELEGLLVAQMTACHNAAMECLRRAWVKDQTFEGRKLNMTYADRFMRTFAVQVEAFSKYRKGGQQKVVVEHVHVYPGGQAIVGSINQVPRGEGGENGNEGSTPCQQVGCAPPEAAPLRPGDRQKMLCPLETDREALPTTGHGQR